MVFVDLPRRRHPRHQDDLRRIHNELEGLGYLLPYANSKHLRDTELGVRIEFLTTGEYPGDGKAKPVSFPDPATVRFDSGWRLLRQSPDIGRVEIGFRHDECRSDERPVGRPGIDQDLELALRARRPTEIPMSERNIWNCGIKPETLRETVAKQMAHFRSKDDHDMIDHCERRQDHLDEMRKSGITLEDKGGVGDDYATLVTTDPEFAKKFGMEEEREYLERKATKRPRKSLILVRDV